MPRGPWLQLPLGRSKKPQPSGVNSTKLKAANEALNADTGDEEVGYGPRVGGGGPPRTDAITAPASSLRSQDQRVQLPPGFERGEVTYLANGQANSPGTSTSSRRSSKVSFHMPGSTVPISSRSTATKSTIMSSPGSPGSLRAPAENPRTFARRDGGAAQRGTGLLKNWRGSLCILGASLAGLFVASSAAGMTAAIMMQSTTTTTTTTSTATTTVTDSWTTTTTATTRTATLTGTTRTSTRTTRTSSTTTTSSATSTTRTVTDTGINSLPSLYCFSASNSSGAELELLRVQLAEMTGIFSCNAWAVFTDRRVWLSPGQYATVAVASPPSRLGPVPGHPQWQQLLNVERFNRIWDKIREQGTYLKHQWVVKVDPDAVFLPPRLRRYLRIHSLSSRMLSYLLNCRTYRSLQGPLEVMTLGAARILLTGRDKCLRTLKWEAMGEDQFLQRCLRHLGATGISGFDILQDTKCGGLPVSCDGTETVAYHPFRTMGEQFMCRHQLSKVQKPLLK